MKNSIVIEGARLIFKNFSGEPDKFNPKGGKRTFGVILDNELADELVADGWNVKYLRPREEDEEPQPFLPVKVTFGNVPPKIVVLSRNKKKMFNEDDISKLDWMTFSNIDLKIRPYEYDVNGKTGVSAYLKTFYGTLLEDELDMKYASIEEDELPFEE